MKTEKIVCVWIGYCATAADLYADYLDCNYDDEDQPISKFGKDAGLLYYDEDAMESWWFLELTVDRVIEYKDNLPDNELYFDDLLAALQRKDFGSTNFISFMFGESGAHETNEMLFAYEGIPGHTKALTFVFRKTYTTM